MSESGRKAYSLTAIVVSGSNAVARLACLVEELALLDHTPESVGSTRRRSGAALIDRWVVVPAAALETAGAVLDGVGVQDTGGGEGTGGVDGKSVAVGTDSKNELVGGDTGANPLLNTLLDTALVVARVASHGEGRVGTARRGPGAVDVVTHDHEVVEGAGEGGEGAVGAGDVEGVVPGVQAGGGGEVELLGLLLAELGEEGGKVCRVVLCDGVAAEALAVGVLPVKVEAVEVVLFDKVEAGLYEGGSVLCAAEGGAEVAAAGPASDGDESLDILHQDVISHCGGG